jgi:hypothetical protein
VARLIFRNGPFAGKAMQLPTGKTITVGRNRDLELPLPDLRLSRRHCQFEHGPGGFLVRDLGSTNGTFVNGERLEGERPLHHLDLVVIGDTEMEFQEPEAIEQGQTRVGRAAGVAVSAALEPDTGIEELSPEEAAAALMAAAPPTGPVPISSPAEDPVLAALTEIDRPLPPEPPPLQAEPAQRSSLLFCDNCNGSIPAIDFDLAVAKEISGKIYCKDCLAKGVAVGADAAAAAPAPARRRGQDLDEILKGLEQVEEIAFEDVPAMPPSAAPVEGSGASTRRHVPVAPPPAAAPAAPTAPGGAPLTMDQFDELLKGEGEAGGEPAPRPAPKPAAKPTPRPAAAARPAPAPAPPKAPAPRQPDEDDDLVEIG